MLFLNNSNQEKSFIRMIDEIFNLEANGIYFKDGMFIEPINKKHEPYPIFSIDNELISIKTNTILVFLNELLIDKFISLLNEKLTEMSNIFLEKMKYNHLNIKVSMETGNDNFVSVKAIKKDDISRNIIYNIKEEHIKYFIKSKSNIIIYNLDHLVKKSVNLYLFSSICELCSIVYDNMNIFDLEDNKIYIDNITYKNIKCFKNIMFISNNKIYDKDPSSIPEYASSWDTQGGIMVCTKRSIGFEIMKHYNEKIIQARYESITDIYNDIYNVKYYKGMIDRDTCNLCNTPLYDLIYVIFLHKYSKKGIPYCGICMHSNYSLFDGKLLYDFTFRNYRSTDYIAKVKYPRSLSDVINGLSIDDEIKIILKLFSEKYNIEIYGNSKYIIFKNYIAWSGSMIDLFYFIRDKKCIPDIHNKKIFHCNIA